MSTDKWLPIGKLSVPAGYRLLDGLANNGWVDRRGDGPTLELRATTAGLNALKAKIPDGASRNENGLKKAERLRVSTELPVGIIADVDDWAALQNTPRSEAICRLVEIGLKTKPK